MELPKFNFAKIFGISTPMYNYIDWFLPLFETPNPLGQGESNSKSLQSHLKCIVSNVPTWNISCSIFK